MAIKFGNYNPYVDAASSMQGPANTLFSIMSELPKQRAQAAEMFARTGLLSLQQQTEQLQQKKLQELLPLEMDLMKARAATEGAQGRHLDAGTGLLGAQTTTEKEMLPLKKAFEQQRTATEAAQGGEYNARTVESGARTGLFSAQADAERQKIGYESQRAIGAQGIMSSLLPKADTNAGFLASGMGGGTANMDQLTRGLASLAAMMGSTNTPALSMAMTGRGLGANETLPGGATGLLRTSPGQILSTPMQPGQTNAPSPLVTNTNFNPVPQRTASLEHQFEAQRAAADEGMRKSLLELSKRVTSGALTPEEVAAERASIVDLHDQQRKEIDRRHQEWLKRSSMPTGLPTPQGTNASATDAPTRTAINPKTGERIGLVGGKWVPMP